MKLSRDPTHLVYRIRIELSLLSSVPRELNSNVVQCNMIREVHTVHDVAAGLPRLCYEF